MFGPQVDLQEVYDRGAQIIDVRSRGEYSQGHGKKSKNIPLDQLSGKVSTLKKSNQPVITCCASGMRSATAAKMLKAQGIEAYNGGSWQSADRLTKA